MIFVETPLFTRQVLELLDDEAYAELQRELVRNPEAGVVIKDTGGIRKIRVAAKGHGKKGGGRVIYYHFVDDSRIAMLMAYPKNVKDDLSATERKALRTIIEKWRNSP